MIMENGMSAVTVKKDEILSTLMENREVHASEYAEARKGYETAFIVELEKNLALAKDGKAFIPYVQLEVPQDHTKDYDRIIRMLQMSVSDTIVITEAEFTQYVLDEWSWKGRTQAVNSAYLAVGKASR